MKIQSIKKLSFEDLQAARPSIVELAERQKLPVSALLDDIRSLNNVGSIFRTADAVRLERLYLSGITGTPPRTEIRKTSLGAEEAVPWLYVTDPLQAIADLRGQGYQIVALEQTTHSVDYRIAEYRFPVCLIVGHEFNGIRDQVIETVDMAVEIPMIGIKQSLNVSVAFGVAIYELFRRWDDKMRLQC